MQQKDSEATARLTRSATLLAKMSVFFLPITFMTSYFSVQIPGLLDGYTARTYWGAFGVIAFISFLCLFFFSRVLMWMSDRLDDTAAGVEMKMAMLIPKKVKKTDEDEELEH